MTYGRREQPSAGEVYHAIHDEVKNPAGIPHPPATDVVAQLERRVNRLSLICQAMWELVREKTSITDQQLADKILEVDLRDGQTDGKIAPVMIECPNCHKPTNSRRPTCVSCGVELKRKHQFEV
jgi:hypothetical protein